MPVKIESITREEARSLNDKIVTATFTVGKPAFTWGEGKSLCTVTAPRGVDAIERTVILKGNRLDELDLGEKVTVVGTLRVIQHPAAKIGEKSFSAFPEIRIEEK